MGEESIFRERRMGTAKREDPPLRTAQRWGTLTTFRISKGLPPASLHAQDTETLLRSERPPFHNFQLSSQTRAAGHGAGARRNSPGAALAFVKAHSQEWLCYQGPEPPAQAGGGLQGIRAAALPFCSDVGCVKRVGTKSPGLKPILRSGCFPLD